MYKVNTILYFIFWLIILSLNLALKTMWILISWLLQKPADLDRHCFQEKPADQDPYCLQELIYIWFRTVFERIICLSTERYKVNFCSFRQVKFLWTSTFWLFICPWTSRKFYYFRTPAILTWLKIIDLDINISKPTSKTKLIIQCQFHGCSSFWFCGQILCQTTYFLWVTVIIFSGNSPFCLKFTFSWFWSC